MIVRGCPHQFSIVFVNDVLYIYDPSDPLHQDRDAIAALWKDIDTEMKCKGKLFTY